MISSWTQHLTTDDEKTGFERQLRNAYDVLERQKEILQDNLDQLDRQESKVDDFKDTDWSHKQAFRNGQRSTLKSILRLITLDK